MVKYEWKSMPSEARLKKKTEQLKEGLKSSILGPQNLGSGGAQAPRAPLDPLVIPQSQLAYICALIEFCHQYFSTINM